MSKTYSPILVTGASGFIGKAMINHLREARPDVEVHALIRETSMIAKGLPLPDRQVHKSDIRDQVKLAEIIAEVKPEAVYHYAGLTSVAYSWGHPLEVTEVNFMGTVYLAELSRKLENLELFLFASTAETYGLTGHELNASLRETDKQHPICPYAVAKVNAEQYLRYLAQVYNFPIRIVRQSNIYGRQPPYNYYVCEWIISHMLKGEAVSLGDPLAVRDFIHVNDVVTAESQLGPGPPVNISTGTGVSIETLARTIASLTRYTGEIKWNTQPKRDMEVYSLILDNSYIRFLLTDWKPIFLLEGLKKTIELWRKEVKP